MGKRKNQDGGAATKSTGRGEEDESSDDDMDMLDVDFEFFDPQEVDFQGLKALCRQLFDIDAQLFDLSALADLILSQPTLGSTIKCNGNESDPYAFLTVLNLHQHKDKEVIKPIIQYIGSRASSSPALQSLPSLIDGTDKAEVGLILHERLLNMPAEVVPPMYRMLQEEITWANDDKEPYNFTHYLILSKTYKEVDSQLDAEENRSAKKMKKDKAQQDNTFYFHPEDEILHNFAVAHGNYDYVSEADSGQADSKRAFQDMGIVPQGHMILIEASKYDAAVEALTKALASS